MNTIYDKETGRVIGTSRGGAPDPRGNVGAVAGDFSRGHYVDRKGNPCPKREVELEISGNEISGIPAGARILSGKRVIAEGDGKPIALAVDFDEELALTIEHPHCHRHAIKLACTADAKPRPKVRKIAIEQDGQELRRRAMPSPSDLMEAIVRGDEVELATLREKIGATDRQFGKLARKGS